MSKSTLIVFQEEVLIGGCVIVQHVELVQGGTERRSREDQQVAHASSQEVISSLDSSYLDNLSDLDVLNEPTDCSWNPTPSQPRRHCI